MPAFVKRQDGVYNDYMLAVFGDGRRLVPASVECLSGDGMKGAYLDVKGVSCECVGASESSCGVERRGAYFEPCFAIALKPVPIANRKSGHLALGFCSESPQNTRRANMALSLGF